MQITRFYKKFKTAQLSGHPDTGKERSTRANRTDSIGESFSAVVTEISREERKPRGEELGCDSEFGSLVTPQERVKGFNRGIAHSFLR